MKSASKCALSVILTLCVTLGLLALAPITASAAFSTAPMVVAGDTHSLALKSDGTVWAWGNNGSGQLGDGTTTQRSNPVQVTGLSGVTAIAVSGAIASSIGFSLALKSDGTVWAWGWNDEGSLGDGTTTNRSTPVQVMASAGVGLSGVTTIAAGYEHSLVLKSDNTVWAWGRNDLGQLGDGTTTAHSYPVQVTGLSGVTAIAAGNQHTLARKSDGTVLAWGYNAYGQLGDGTTTNRSSVVQVMASASVPLGGVSAIAAGGYHSFVLKSDGMVWAWGDNTNGQLGDGTTTNRSYPVQVMASAGVGLDGVTTMSGGSDYSLVLKSDGTVWAWGRNAYGQLGDGTSTNRSNPVQVGGAGFSLNVAVAPDKGIFGTSPKWDGQGSHWWHYLLFFLCFGFIWMWF